MKFNGRHATLKDVQTTTAEALLKTLVDSPSSTTSQTDVRRTHEILANALSALGFKNNWIRDPTSKTADLLVAERPGKRSSGSLATFITCVSHIDTVLSPVEAGKYRREETASGVRARGAGILDNKGGLAVLVESLRLFLLTNSNPEISFRVVSSPDEETGSSAWHENFRQAGLDSAAVLGFEPALDDGAIISSRRGNRWYNIEIRGAEAHAGRCKGEEINAAHEAARMISRFLEVRDRLGISLNVGHVEGGRDRHNVVCGSVRMKLDTRFTTFAERDALHKALVEIFNSPSENSNDGRKSEVSFEIVDDCPPFAADSKTETLIGELCSIVAARENRTTLQATKAGGAGDVNHMSRPGLLVLDGLGPVGGRMHTKEEFLELSTLQSRAEALSLWYPTLIKYCHAPSI